MGRITMGPTNAAPSRAVQAREISAPVAEPIIKEVIVEVPVERVVEVVKWRDMPPVTVEVERVIEIPVERVVERIVEVPKIVEKFIEIERKVEVPVQVEILKELVVKSVPWWALAAMAVEGLAILVLLLK